MQSAAWLILCAAGWSTAVKAAGWQRLIDPGPGTDDKAQRIVVAADGGLAVLSERAGTTYRLTRVDLKGNVKPATGLPGTVDDMHAASFVATADGGFAGGGFGPRFVRYDKKLARTAKRLDPFPAPSVAAPRPDEDGNFVLSFLAPQSDGSFVALAQSQKALVRFTIDKAGAIGPEQKALGSFNRLSSLGGTALLKDGALAVTGDTDADRDDDRHVRVVKLDAQGKIAYDVSFGGKRKDYGESLAATSDGGLLVGGGTTSSGAGALDWYLAKLDQSGKKVWEKTLGTDGNDFIARVVELPGGGFVAGGNFKDRPTLVKLDPTGAVVWQKSFPRAFLADLAALPDGGVAAVAVMRPEGFKHYLTLVIRADAKGDVGATPKTPKPPPSEATAKKKPPLSAHPRHGLLPHGLPHGTPPVGAPADATPRP